MWLTGLALLAGSAFAQTTTLSRERHAWGRFPVNSWTKVRRVTDELDEKGVVTGSTTTETKSTLLEVTEKAFVLQTEVTVEVAGKRFTAQPKSATMGYSGESNGDNIAFKKIGQEALDVGGAKTPCDVLEGTFGEGAAKMISTLHFSDRVAPFVLRRETKPAAGTPAQAARNQMTVDVIAVDMPFKVLAEYKNVAYVRTLQRQPKVTTFTLEIYCAEVPGGVVAHTSKELDATGRQIRRSTLELLDYGIGDDPDSSGLRRIFHHTRTRRTGVPVPP